MNLCTLAYPALTGWAVGDLVKRSYGSLSVMIAVWLVHLVVSERVGMMRGMVGFFEADVPAMFSQVVTMMD